MFRDTSGVSRTQTLLTGRTVGPSWTAGAAPHSGSTPPWAIASNQARCAQNSHTILLPWVDTRWLQSLFLPRLFLPQFSLSSCSATENGDAGILVQSQFAAVCPVKPQSSSLIGRNGLQRYNLTIQGSQAKMASFIFIHPRACKRHNPNRRSLRLHQHYR